MSKSVVGLLCFWKKQDFIDIDEKQNFIFNQQVELPWADVESNGFKKFESRKHCSLPDCLRP